MKAVDPETTVQESVSTSVSMKPLDIFKDMFSHFYAMFAS